MRSIYATPIQITIASSGTSTCIEFNEPNGCSAILEFSYHNRPFLRISRMEMRSGAKAGEFTCFFITCVTVRDAIIAQYEELTSNTFPMDLKEVELRVRKALDLPI